MNRTRTLGAAAAVALALAPVGAVLAPSVALASFPGTPGRIVFDGVLPNADPSAPSTNAIFAVNPDGSDLRQLTDGTQTALGPDVSADGSKIVYSLESDVDHAEVWVMNADGSGKHQVTSDGTRDWYPTWSPDGRTIAFRSDQTGNGDIYTIPATGGPETQLTTAAGLDSLPRYSPDGTKILFHSKRNDPHPTTCAECDEGVFVMNADGSDQHEIVGQAGEEDTFPNWSPDGRRIVYSRYLLNASSPLDGLWLADPDGSNASQVAGPDGSSESGDFSPDGQNLVFEEGGDVMRTVPVTGGTPRTIETSDEANPLSVVWSGIPTTTPSAQAPVVSGVYPGDGPQAGGTTVTLDGQHLLGTTAVHFGGMAATDVSVISDVQMTVTAPAGTGAVDVTVTNPAGTSATSTHDTYTYDTPPSPPTVTGISPISGEAGGGTSVVITGTGLSGATGVSFGGVAATSFTQDSDSQVTAVSPAGSGTVDVTVTTPNGTSATSTADQFTYTVPAPAAPQVTDVSPNAGPRSGGTTVTLTGSGFTGATKVTVGGTKARFTVVGDTTITLKTPASSSTGVRQIRVTGPSGTSATGPASGFTYGDPPVVSRISPAGGSVRGGTVVTVTGSGFTGPTVVHVGTKAGIRVRVVSATKLTVTSPAGAVGTVDVRVGDAFGTSPAVAADRFQYRRP